jgi:ParB/RepB/Spo0J family partition protein
MNRPVAQRVRIADLRPHPRQDALFGDLTGPSFDFLVEDIRRNGLRQPIEILEDRTIVCGHQRVRAATILGWPEVDAIVLEVTDDGEIERRMIEDNLARRTLGPVGLARIYRELKLSACDKKIGVSTGDLRDHLARLMGRGRSGRTLDRYERILDAPREIQDAVDAGSVPRSMAERAIALSEADRSSLVAEIQAGGHPSEVLAAYLRPAAGSGVERARKIYRKLLLNLRTATPILKSHRAKLAGQAFEPGEAAEIIARSMQILTSLGEAERRLNRRVRARIASLAARFRTRRR